MLPFETRMKLYQSFIVPHFNYCAETWNFCSKGATTKLEKLNERALRFVYRDYSSSYEMLLKQSGYQTLLNQRLAKILTTVYKVANRQGVSESLCDLVELRESNYNLRGDKLTNKEASTALCSVVKHAGSGRARKKCRGKHETQSSVFPYFLSALPLPKCFTTEQSSVEASLFVL